jgi:hypothetical protein
MKTILKNFKGWGEEGEERATEGLNMIKVHCMHIWKYYNETHHFASLIYANKIWKIVLVEMIQKQKK